MGSTVASLIADYGGWGAWFVTASGVLYLVLTGKLVAKERLDAEVEEKKFWRQAATLSTEMGAILTKGRDDNDE